MKHVRLIALGLLVATTAWASPTPGGIPAALQPTAGESLAMTLMARGVQIYECNAGEWKFVAPEAELFDVKGQRIGHHGAGPFWQAADGSHVVGKVKTRANAPVTGTIPWLLLTTQSTGPQGVFSKVTSIQRVDTTGGAAPQSDCTANTQTRVAYTAIYRLFSSN
jgi:hypothetical protein